MRWYEYKLIKQTKMMGFADVSELSRAWIQNHNRQENANCVLGSLSPHH
jgi:hypothetical protein